MVDEIDKAADILMEAIELNGIGDKAAICAFINLYVSYCIANNIRPEDFCEGMDKLKIDYKKHYDAFKI